jgi:hypothetical protein
MGQLRSLEAFSAARASFSMSLSSDRSEVNDLRRTLADLRLALVREQGKVDDLERDLAAARSRLGHLRRSVQDSASVALRAKVDARKEYAFFVSEGRKYYRNLILRRIAAVRKAQEGAWSRGEEMQRRAERLRRYRDRLRDASQRLIGACAAAAPFAITVVVRGRRKRGKSTKPVVPPPAQVAAAKRRAAARILQTGKE